MTAPSYFRQSHTSFSLSDSYEVRKDLAITVLSVEEQLSGWYTYLRKATQREKVALAYQGLTDTVISIRAFAIFTFRRNIRQTIKGIPEHVLADNCFMVVFYNLALVRPIADIGNIGKRIGKGCYRNVIPSWDFLRYESRYITRVNPGRKIRKQERLVFQFSVEFFESTA